MKYLKSAKAKEMIRNLKRDTENWGIPETHIHNKTNLFKKTD